MHMHPDRESPPAAAMLGPGAGDGSLRLRVVLRSVVPSTGKREDVAGYTRTVPSDPRSEADRECRTPLRWFSCPSITVVVEVVTGCGSGGAGGSGGGSGGDMMIIMIVTQMAFDRCIRTSSHYALEGVPFLLFESNAFDAFLVKMFFVFVFCFYARYRP